MATETNKSETCSDCAHCGSPFKPHWLEGLRKWSRLCDSCAIINLAMFMEHTEPEDSVRDIHEGEQIGAWLRDRLHS